MFFQSIQGRTRCVFALKTCIFHNNDNLKYVSISQGEDFNPIFLVTNPKYRVAKSYARDQDL